MPAHIRPQKRRIEAAIEAAVDETCKETRCMDLYVYYRVRCEDAERFQALAATMQQSLARKGGITASLKRRPKAADGRHTWMEVYSGVPEDFDATLANALAGSGLTELIDGERHPEYFMDMSTCA
jgi:hypothetical protein